jgi:hypothetical protein
MWEGKERKKERKKRKEKKGKSEKDEKGMVNFLSPPQRKKKEKER